MARTRSLNPVPRKRTALDEIHLNEAVQAAAKSGKIRAIAREYAVPRSTLRRRINGAKTRAEAHVQQQLLSPAVEQLLLDAGDRDAADGCGWTTRTLRYFAQAACKALGLHPPGKQWTANFLARHAEYKEAWSQGRAYSYIPSRSVSPSYTPPPALGAPFPLTPRKAILEALEYLQQYPPDSSMPVNHPSVVIDALTHSHEVAALELFSRTQKVEKKRREWRRLKRDIDQTQISDTQVVTAGNPGGNKRQRAGKAKQGAQTRAKKRAEEAEVADQKTRGGGERCERRSRLNKDAAIA